MFTPDAPDYRQAIVRQMPLRWCSTKTFLHAGYTTKAVAIAGYPLVSSMYFFLPSLIHIVYEHDMVPLGFLSDTTKPTPNPSRPLHDKAPGMPFGSRFMGTPYSEYQLIRFAYAFEQAMHV